jgi:Tfp pilus assembly ATPase PilU
MSGRIDYSMAVAYADSPNDVRLRIKMSQIKKEDEERKEPGFKLKSEDFSKF